MLPRISESEFQSCSCSHATRSSSTVRMRKGPWASSAETI